MMVDVLQGTPNFYSDVSKPRIPYNGTWQHIAVTVSRISPGNITFYLNGSVIGTGDARERPGSLGSNGSLRVGAGTVDATDSFQGSIDELEIFNRVLMATEITAIYNARTFGKCKPTPPCGGDPSTC